MMRQAVREAFILCFIAVVLALIVYAVRPDKIGPAPAASDSDGTGPIEPALGSAEISLDDAVRVFRDGGAIFADARHAADFESGHIKGALNLYAADQDAWLSDFLSDADPATVIVTYCDGQECHLAVDLAQLLSVNGFNKVFYLTNGWTRWRELGLPAGP
jgi:rhodanese-related sulfurtransferase